MEINLSFLEAGKKYKNQIYADNAHYKNNPTAINISQKELSSTNKLSLKLAAGSNCAVRFG